MKTQSHEERRYTGDMNSAAEDEPTTVGACVERLWAPVNISYEQSR